MSLLLALLGCLAPHAIKLDGEPEDTDTAAGASDETAVFDSDRDGYPRDEDCRDDDPSIHPGATEVCNGIDDDCDTLVDAADTDVRGALTAYPDADLDGWGADTGSLVVCAIALGYASTTGDCDDANPAVNPEAVEVCNDLDDDCNGLTDHRDPACTGVPLWYADTDGDGYGDPDVTQDACDAHDGWVSNNTDCDDADATNACAAGCDGIDLASPAWAGCTCANWGGHDYVYCDSGATWTDAEASCESVGSHLVVIDDAAEDQWVYDSLLAIHATKWWIGYSDPRHTGTFEWVYPQPSGYTNWRAGEPSGGEYCVHHWYEWDPFAWNDEACSDSKRWICEFEGESPPDGADTGT